MHDLIQLMLRWGDLVGIGVLLLLQIYAYRRTGHYSLALLAAASFAGFLAGTLVRLLNSESVDPNLYNGVYAAIGIFWLAYTVLGTWGVVALFQSYIQLTEANKKTTDQKSSVGGAPP
jgi:hypothetical protein